MAKLVLSILVPDKWAVLDLGDQWSLAQWKGEKRRWQERRYQITRACLERDIYELVYETVHEYEETGRTWLKKDKKTGETLEKPVLRVRKFYTAPEATQMAVRELINSLPERYA